MNNSDFLFASNSVFIEDMKRKYLSDKNSVAPDWQKFFESSSVGDRNDENFDDVKIPRWLKIKSKVVGAEDLSQVQPQNKNQSPSKESTSKDFINKDAINKDIAIKLIKDEIVNKYRKNGHLLAKLDPLEIEKLPSKSEVNLDFTQNQNYSNYEFLDKNDLNQFTAKLDDIYSKNIGVEFDHINDKIEKDWLYNKFESLASSSFSKEEQKSYLECLIKIEDFEQYLHTKYPGAKRFSCEGNEAGVLAMEISIAESAKKFGVSSAYIGMAHRGRLASLTAIAGKLYEALIYEFNGNSAFQSSFNIAGDVKYHMGYDGVRKIDNKDVDVCILPNPSHLEAVNTVLMGRVRAEQDSNLNLDKNNKPENILPILVHGDAAFCGQGIVAETLNMSGVSAYNICGIVHIVTNNQIGYTANPKDGSPGRYCTEYAKLSNSPIIHVNADKIEDVIRCVKLAAEYRYKFKKDIVIDVVGYRKYGHNEGDEPAYTQGYMYDKIRKKLSVQKIYADHLISSDIIKKEEYDDLKNNFKKTLDKSFDEAKKYQPNYNPFKNKWEGFKKIDDVVENSKIETGIETSQINNFANQLSKIPSSIKVHSKLQKIIENRLENFSKNKIDWSMGEALAFASILMEFKNIRITGQDSGRGTFAHRHSVLHDTENENKKYIPLNNISENQANYFVADSCLSEFGVLGFEYGYSLYDPKNLVIWEAQFGDFANGAQTIIDQFISSAETKWLQMSGLVMLLPHGYEGQGPEHSSARLERYLELCANDNMFVANPTTPASFFHLLRRQVKLNFRKPLIVMTPKSLLRHPLAVSGVEDFSGKTSFKTIIDYSKAEKEKVKKIIFCSGKIYYDLFEYGNKAEEDGGIKTEEFTIIRIEQLYPFDKKNCVEILKKYASIKEIIWCQEENMNMGAYNFIRPIISEIIEELNLGLSLKYCGRKPSSSPACGYLSVHNKEQKEIIESVFKK